MTDAHGGRVLAGEDSEEDEEDEEELSFQFNGFGAQSSPAAPHFAVRSVVAPQQGAESDEESDESGGEECKQEGSEDVEEATKTASTEPSSAGPAEEAEQVETSQSSTAPVEQPQETQDGRLPAQEDLWEVDASLDGLKLMSDAFVSTLQPSLDASIRRILELKESQQRLLKLLTQQNEALQANKQLEGVAVVLEKLPHYVRKVQTIKLAMAEISTSTDKMKHRTESLRIDAQSYAIKKENKRDAQSQWNKLYAAKSASDSAA